MSKKLSEMYMRITLMMTLCLMAILPVGVALAAADENFGNLSRGEELDGNVQWPWTRFLNSLAREVTGPLPLVIGILAVTGAGVALLFGNGGAGTQKALTMICVIGVIMFTPTLVQYIYASASGATVDMVIDTVSTAPQLLP